MSKQHHGVLTQEQVRFFAENGYLHLKHMIDPWELDRLDVETLKMIDYCKQVTPPNGDYLYSMDPVTGNRVLRRINGMYTKGDVFFALYGHPHLLGIAESIHGPNIVTWQDAMVVKLPKYGVPVPWHRDPGNVRVQPPFDVDVYLDAATPENGCLYVVPGSHLWQGFDLQDMFDEHGFMLPGAIPVVTEPGDILLHSPNLLHGSRATRGKAMRRVIYFAFFTIEEMLSRGGQWDADYVRLWISVMLKAIESRARLPETADEAPFEYNPTLEEFKLDPQNLGYVERQITVLREGHDLAYRYSPLNTVKAKI
jgi:hypothetical protein